MKILVILGTAREGRYSERVAKAVFNEVKKRSDIEPVFVDVRDHVFGATINGSDEDPRIRPWKDLVTNADALFFVTPEYNRGFPGELKMLIDSAFDEYVRKPVAICGVSDGGFGGARGIEALRALLAYLQMIPVQPNINVSKVDVTFSADGSTSDPKFYEKVNKAADQLVELAKLLRSK
ncbi:MAG: NAD(P)H-dependent oxidoreductase [Candidatus Taylorbacteria bacterium]|nr:NAD(P)H-dependent oxidoreductase [Candidatus Taylorbacteria bacterium]